MQNIFIFIVLLLLAKFVFGIGWELVRAALDAVGLLKDRNSNNSGNTSCNN